MVQLHVGIELEVEQHSEKKATYKDTAQHTEEEYCVHKSLEENDSADNQGAENAYHK